MYQTLSRTLVGVSPLLMHNGRLANPLDSVVKEMKLVTSKQKKTDKDHKLLSDLEWLGSIYTTDDFTFKVKGYEISIETDAKLAIPGENLEAMLIIAGTKAKRKDAFKAGVIADGSFPLTHNGPKNVPELFSKDGYRHIQGVRVQRSRVMRTRAIFRSWKLPVVIKYLPGLLNAADIDTALELAGSIIGLGDYRPKYGRFAIEMS